MVYLSPRGGDRSPSQTQTLPCYLCLISSSLCGAKTGAANDMVFSSPLLCTCILSVCVFSVYSEGPHSGQGLRDSAILSYFSLGSQISLCVI